MIDCKPGYWMQSEEDKKKVRISANNTIGITLVDVHNPKATKDHHHFCKVATSQTSFKMVQPWKTFSVPVDTFRNATFIKLSLYESPSSSFSADSARYVGFIWVPVECLAKRHKAGNLDCQQWCSLY